MIFAKYLETTHFKRFAKLKIPVTGFLFLAGGSVPNRLNKSLMQGVTSEKGDYRSAGWTKERFDKP